MSGGGVWRTKIVYNHYAFISERHAALITLGMRKILEQTKAEAKKTLKRKPTPDTPGTFGLDTSTLQKAIYYRKVKELVYELYVAIEYAEYVEFGTTKMDALPFMYPAAKKGGAAIEAMVGAVLAQGGV